jgi:phosphoribosylanthranilate isomerase
MTCVKICGINSESAFDVAVEAGADYLGFVFFLRSPRYVTARQAAALSGRQRGGPRRIGLFVAPEADEVQAVLDSVPLDGLQIYGPAALCQELRAQFGVPVYRAIGVASRPELPVAAAGIDGFVIEAKPPANATRPGGNGVSVDPAVLKGWQAPARWLLGGGLTAENVAAAIAASGAPGVDVSSGVESLPGVKSPVLIRRFIANARLVARLVG